MSKDQNKESISINMKDSEINLRLSGDQARYLIRTLADVLGYVIVDPLDNTYKDDSEDGA